MKKQFPYIKVAFVFVNILWVLHNVVFAYTYGENTYGSGTYNVGTTIEDSSNRNKPSKSFKCDEDPPKYAPTLSKVEARSDSSIALIFTGVENPVDHYALQFGIKSGTYNWGDITIGNEDTRAFLVKNLTPNTTYYFRVRAGNFCAKGAWSQERSATTLAKGKTLSKADEGTETPTNSTTSESTESIESVKFPIQLENQLIQENTESTKSDKNNQGKNIFRFIGFIGIITVGIAVFTIVIKKQKAVTSTQ